MAPKIQDSGRAVHGRFEITIEKHRFLPRPLNIDERLTNNKPILPVEAGAVFRLGTLPAFQASDHVRAAFDCSTIPGSSPSQLVARPALPKLLLPHVVVAPAGKAVRAA
eukprot:15444962-Alexandrium_andersonii.AAC.1